MNLVIWIILVAVLFYLALIYTSPALALLGIMTALFVLLGRVLLLLLRLSAEARLVASVALAQENERVKLRLLINRSSPVPCSRAEAWLVIRNQHAGTVRRERILISGPGRGEQRVKLYLTLQQPGHYELRLKKLRMYDLSGLMYTQLASRQTLDVDVLPDAFPVAVRLTEPVRSFFGDSDVYDEEKAGPDRSELFAIRPFAVGDKLQSIHWKLSAKTQELMVKENSLPRACPVVLFLTHRKDSLFATARAKGKKTRDRKRREEEFGCFLRCAASLSFSMMDAGCPHYIVWYDETSSDVTRIRVDDEESYYLFLNFFLRESGELPAGEQSLKDRYEEKYRHEPYLRRLELDSGLSLSLDGELLAEANRRTYEDVWKDLELTL